MLRTTKIEFTVEFNLHGRLRLHNDKQFNYCLPFSTISAWLCIRRLVPQLLIDLIHNKKEEYPNNMFTIFLSLVVVIVYHEISSSFVDVNKKNEKAVYFLTCTQHTIRGRLSQQHACLHLKSQKLLKLTRPINTITKGARCIHLHVV